MTQTFTTQQYLEAIHREQGKRATTYPKIIKKMQNDGVSTLKEIEERQRSMNAQNVNIQAAWLHIAGYGKGYEDWMRQGILSELMRELKMRKSYYPRLIWLDRNRKSQRMTQETADYEIMVWEALTRHFAKEYLGLDELPTKRRKKQ